MAISIGGVYMVLSDTHMGSRSKMKCNLLETGRWGIISRAPALSNAVKNLWIFCPWNPTESIETKSLEPSPYRHW